MNVFCVNTAAAVAGVSEQIRARSSAPLFLIPAATAAVLKRRTSIGPPVLSLRLRAVALALRALRLRAVALALRALRLRAVALALRVLRTAATRPRYIVFDLLMPKHK